MFRWIVRRDLILAWRRRADVLATLFFFVIVVSLFPLSTSPEPALLRTIAPGVVWVAALLASMLSLGRLFANDYQDGTLEQMLLTPQPLYLTVCGKILAQWLVSEVPLVIAAPVLGLQFGLSRNTLAVLMLSLLLGTPVLSLIGVAGSFGGSTGTLSGYSGEIITLTLGFWYPDGGETLISEVMHALRSALPRADLTIRQPEGLLGVTQDSATKL